MFFHKQIWIHAYLLCFYKRIKRKLSHSIQNHISAYWLKIRADPHFCHEENNLTSQNPIAPQMHESPVRSAEDSPFSMADSFSTAALNISAGAQKSSSSSCFHITRSRFQFLGISDSLKSKDWKCSLSQRRKTAPVSWWPGNSSPEGECYPVIR